MQVRKTMEIGQAPRARQLLLLWSFTVYGRVASNSFLLLVRRKMLSTNPKPADFARLGWLSRGCRNANASHPPFTSKCPILLPLNWNSM